MCVKSIQTRLNDLIVWSRLGEVHEAYGAAKPLEREASSGLHRPLLDLVQQDRIEGLRLRISAVSKAAQHQRICIIDVTILSFGC